MLTYAPNSEPQITNLLNTLSVMAEKKNSIAVYILGFLIFIQLGVIVFLLVTQDDQKKVIIQNVDTSQKDSLEIATKIEEFRLVGEELKKLKAEMLAMGINKDSIGAELDEMLEALWQAEMGGAITIGDLNAKIAKSKQLLVFKDLQIKRLKEKSDSLSFEAKVLNSEREFKVQKISDILNDNRDLSVKLNIASRVKAENIKITGINKKEKVIEKEVYKTKDLTKINISFNLEENKVAKKNKKIIIMFRLIEAGAVVIFNETNGGGYFKTEEKEELPYTEKQVIEFDNTKQVVNFIYQKESDYLSGVYKVELYADGYIIGESEFQVK